MQSVFRISSICLLLLSLSTNAQRLYNNKCQGPYILLYKLTPTQVAFLAKNPQKIDSQFLFTQLVGKLSVDSLIPLHKSPSDEFPIKPFTDKIRHQKFMAKFHVWDIRQNGYFLEVCVNSLYTAAYRLIENPLFNAGVYKIGYESFIFVEDTAGLPVYNASVHLDTAYCPYDSSVGGYKIKGKNISGILKIERGNQFSMITVNGYLDKSNNTKPPGDNYQYNTNWYDGYMVTNKPRYKPWDTLFFKSFLVNSDGKPLKGKLIARLFQNSSGYAKEYKIKRTEKGAYNGYFIINDSFTLDQEITLTLLNKYRTQIKSQSVMLENYELRDINFELRADKYLVTPGGGIKFYASASTANRLPIMDGRLTFKVRLNTVNFTDGDSVVIPFEKYNNWYSSSVQTDPSGVTVFDMPDSVFIPLDGSYSVTCALLTADNETREATLVFNYQTTRDRQEASLEKDSLNVKRLYNMKSVRREMRIKLWSKKDLIADSIFHTPLKLYLPPNVYLAQIFRGDTLSGSFYRATQLPEVSGKRTHDSISIQFTSAFDIPVFYRLYANNKLVNSGQNTNLIWKVKDKSKNSYHIQYGILEGSVTTPRFYSRSFHLAEKELTVDIIQPATIYPGQDVAIEIQVKDAYGKPVNKVNLAAWAVSTQLEGIVAPDVPYLGLLKPQKELPIKNWPLIPFQATYQAVIKDWQLKEFFLIKNDIFKLVYPSKGFAVLTDTTPGNTTEIEFYAHGKQLRQNIIYVKANDTLFISQKNSPKPEVFRIKPGKYDFKVRTFDRIFNFKNVEIMEGKKNFVCLQIDSLKQQDLGDSMPAGILDSMELEMFYLHSLLFRFDSYLNDTLIVKINGKLIHGFQTYNLLNKATLSTALYNPDKSIRKQMSRQEFFIFGQLNSEDEVELYWKNHYSHLIKFIPGFSYGFTANDQVSDFNKEWTKEIKFLQLQNYNNYAFNTFWWDPEFKDSTKKIITPYKPETPYYSSGELTEFQYSDYAHPIEAPAVYNSIINIYLANIYSIQKIWLFDRNDSTYSILQNSSVANNSYPAIGINAIRNMWTISPKKKLQNFRLVVEMNDSTWFVKNMSIDSSVHLFYTLNPKQFRKLGKAEYILYDRLAKNLTREEMAVWPDTPTINKGLFVISLNQKNGKTSIEGTVIGPGIKYPVQNAFVVLEKNGLFVRGAITNREGRFYMDKLQPGTYMLKIKADNYNYWIHYSLEIKAGFNHLVQAEMKPFAWLVYEADGYSVSGDGPGDSYSNTWMGASESYSATSPQSYNMNITTSKDILRLPQRGIGAIANAASGVSFFGSRTDGTRIFVDGVPVIRSSSIPSAGQEEIWGYGNIDDPEIASDLGLIQWSSADRKAEDERLNQMAGDKNAKRTRKDFKDYAYWIPNLYTNKQGKAGFTVKYPDNVTSWRTFVPAMDGHRHSGLGELTVRSYKPITTSLALPLFLTEGDSLLAYGRVMNYTGKMQQGKYYLKYNQNVLTKEINFKDMYTDSMKVNAVKSGDTISVEAGFELANGYRDAEMRKIIVNAGTVISGKSIFKEISSDTTYMLKAEDGDIGMDVAIYNQNLSLILEMISKIENLTAFDNRSVAAYLNALLIKKSVCKTLNIPFTQERKIREAMSKLKKSQSDNGLFGWFKGGKHNYIVSAYVAEVMFKANQMGYENNTWLNAARTIETNIPSVSGQERLEYLLTLKKMNRSFFYDSFSRSLKPDKMDRSEKLEYWHLMQLMGKKIPLDEVNELLEITNEGNLKVAGTWDWKIAPVTDDAANTYKAWQILFNANAHKERRNSLVDFMATECTSSGNSWIKAAEAMLAEALKDSSIKSKFNPEVFVNGQLIPIENLPTTYHLMPGQSLSLKHKGSPVYLAANRKFRTYTPKSDSTQFDIKISVPQIKENHFTAGVPVDMKVTVFSKRNQYNTVIEIPIPAGCVYGTKIQGESWVESHREYQNDRVLIFSDELPFCYHTFTVRLVPRFSGTFNTAPARSALMFYPDKAAFTAKQRLLVGK